MEIKKIKKLSVVLPLYNEEGNISVLYMALVEELNKITSDFEIIFVDDGSKDQSVERIKEIADKDERVLGISLSRNFGHQIALVAGLEHTSGEFVVMMDADMQHPPKVIGQLYTKALEGYDIVNTIRDKVKGERSAKSLSSNWFYRLSNKLTEVQLHRASADFRLMNRKTVDAFLQMKEKDRFTRGLISWMGYKQAFVHFTPSKRHSGLSKYSYRKMIGFAADGIFSFSSKPLRISFYLGILVSFLALIYGGYVLVQYFMGNTIQGWASMMIVVLFLGGIQLLSIGVIGEYIARVFNEVKNRPLYNVRKYFSKRND